MSELIRIPILPGIEEQRVGDNVYLVATSREAFAGFDIRAARCKPGVCIVMMIRTSTFMLVYAKDEFLPEGTEIYEGLI